MKSQLQAHHLNQNTPWIRASLEALHLHQADNKLSSLKSLTSTYPVYVKQNDIDAMNRVIEIVGKLRHNKRFQEAAFERVPEIAQFKTAAQGVLFGFDFHLTDNGPKLIEINTNAGAIFLNNYLNQSQLACCASAQSLMASPTRSTTQLNETLLNMFQQEFSASSNSELKHIAIVDDIPEQQFLYDEFLMFKTLFEQHGIKTSIADPNDLEYDGSQLSYKGSKIDLIYNRHTDFYLEGSDLEHIKSAYLNEQVVLTPNPRAYGLAADKRLLCLLSNHHFIEELDINIEDKTALLAALPHTQHVNTENADDFWRKRKSYFFKPSTGFGSKAVYRGSKLTKRVWNEIILAGNFIAQEYIAPSQKLSEHEGRLEAYKVDFRNYVYDDKILLLAARLYRGQATNMSTPGGGFATVYATSH